MDLGIVVNKDRTKTVAVPMAGVNVGDEVVTGRTGIRVVPLQRPQERDVFSFMESQVSAERPHGHIIADVAKRMEVLRDGHRRGKSRCKVLVAGGPAIIHAGEARGADLAHRPGICPCPVLWKCPSGTRHGGRFVWHLLRLWTFGRQSGSAWS